MEIIDRADDLFYFSNLLEETRKEIECKYQKLSSFFAFALHLSFTVIRNRYFIFHYFIFIFLTFNFEICFIVSQNFLISIWILQFLTNFFPTF